MPRHWIFQANPGTRDYRRTDVANRARMAIRELADHARFIHRRPRLGVVVPARPFSGFEELIRSQGIYTIRQSEPAKFADNSLNRRFV